MKALNDLQQRQKALDVQHSFLIQAPAGSGKTELLIQRYLKLLSEAVLNPEEIIAITFTRKAAGEMRQRIIAALESALNSIIPENPHQAETWKLATNVIAKDEASNWQIIQNPTRLQILTIDAFSTKLTKQMPILSQFGAEPIIDENIEALFEKASEQILTNLEKDHPWNKSLEILLNYLDNDMHKAHRLFISMLYCRDQWLPYVFQKNPRKTLETALKNIIENHLEKIFNLLKGEEKLLESLNFAASNLTNHPLNAYQNTKTFFPPTIEFLAQWQAIANLLLIESGEFRSNFTKKQGFLPISEAKNSEEKQLFQYQKEQLQQLLNEWSTDQVMLENLWILKTLPAPRYSDEQWEMLNALVTLLPILVAHLQVLFKQTGAVDYTEITLRALQALGQADNPTDLALALDYKIKHILVDEFQDTSVNQFRLLELVTTGWMQNDGRTLFLVGDPMQSIYRFRKAEVGLFIKARDYGINQIKLNFLQLTVNFRSTANIVEWNNKLYNKIFPAHDDLAMSQVKFSTSEAYGIIEKASYIKLHPYFTVDSSDEAALLIETIKQAYSINPLVKIAILVLARGHLDLILKNLKQHHLVYRAVELENLFHNIIIQDLLSLTKALLNLSDKIAWYSVLRAPWCGLSLADLLIIKENTHDEIILNTLDNSSNLPLSESGKLSLNRIAPILKRSWLYLHDFDLSYLVESTWLALGGPACITEHDDINVRRFFECLEKFEKEYHINDISMLESKLKKLTAESPIPVENFIEVMTIHKAKGLEFDVVLIPGLDKSTRGDDHQLLVWQEIPLAKGEAELLLAPIKSSKKDPIYDYIRYLEKEKLTNELNRLLYVATTRAKHDLHLFFAVELDEHNQNQFKEPRTGSLLSQLWQAIKAEITIGDNPTKQTTNLSTDPVKFIKRINSTWKHPYPCTFENTIFKKQNSLAVNRRYANWHYEYQKIFGRVFHKAIESISSANFIEWSQASNEEKQKCIYTIVKNHHVPTEFFSDCVKTTLLALEKMQNDTFGSWLLQQESLMEYEISYKSEEGQIKKCIVDKIILTKDTIWIIDFKTAEPSDIELDTFLHQQKKHYHEQLMQYKQTVSHLYTQTIRTGLYFPLIPAWLEYE